MTYRVSYSAAQPGSFVQVPAAYVSQVMRHVGDIDEFKVTLLVFHLLSRSREYPAYVSQPDVVLKAASLLGLGEPSCSAGLSAAVQRGVFLELHLLVEDGGSSAVYFANLEADLDAIQQLQAGSDRGDAATPRAPNIFALYEQNIGIITPMMAEELKDAQRTYPAEWIEDAFREAVKAQKQNWKYVGRILERWRVEGRGSGANRSGVVPDDPDKYVRGRYGRIVRR